MIRLEYYADRCTDCGDCDVHHLKIRELARVSGDHYLLNLREWSQIQETIRAAVSACKTGAIQWTDERGEWA